MGRIGFKTTDEVPIPDNLIQQVIGQEDAVLVIKKAAEQRRHVMLIGDPGTGKSMLAQAMAELLPARELEDVIVYPNDEDGNNPKVRVVPAGKGEDIVKTQKADAMLRKENKAKMKIVIIASIIGLSLLGWIFFGQIMILFIGLIAAAIVWFVMRGGMMPKNESENIPRLLVNHKGDKKSPFEDATGAHAGALLGDVKHDPFQSGGLETPAHDRVEVGAIHKAHKGVLFIDEMNLLRIESQQSLLTALQEKKFPITGQSERSSGAMVKTEPVPCDFTLVAAGNLDSIEGMHPALRSRIRGYGYEVYVKSTMPDTEANRKKMITFIAQEVSKDQKIPAFDRAAVAEVIHEAQRRAGARGKLSLRFRELGGLVRAAGDVAREEKAKLVSGKHVLKGRKIARSLESQIAERIIERKQEYNDIIASGAEVGTVNGLAVMGADSGISELAGIVMRIVAEVTPAQSRNEGQIIATGKLGDIAKEAVHNVSALIKKRTGVDISNRDIHIQFIGTYEGVEGDSASVSIATAVVSALEGIPVDLSTAMTGSLSIRGEVLPIGGVTAKIEAAAEMGIKKVLIPRANLKDVLIEEKYQSQVQVIPVDTLEDVLAHALVSGPRNGGIVDKLSSLVPEEKERLVPSDRIYPA